MSDVTVTLGADAAEFKQALTEIQKSVDSLVNSTTAKTAQLGLCVFRRERHGFHGLCRY